MNHGINTTNVDQLFTNVGPGNLWAYNEALLGGRNFPSGLQVVPKKFNDMKMFSAVFVKFNNPCIKQTDCIKAVQFGYCALVDRWLANHQEQDDIARVYATRLCEPVKSTVRKRVNRLLNNANKWPITKNRAFSFKTFGTPGNGRSHESQATIDCLKAAIIKNAIEHHEKHKAKAPPSCESLLDAVRPDKVVEFLMNCGSHCRVVPYEISRVSPTVSESVADNWFEGMEGVEESLFLDDAELAIPPEDGHEPFFSMLYRTLKTHYEDPVSDDLSEFY